MDEQMDLRELRWQCRRGMRELDVLLTGYLESQYEASDDRYKAAFRQLLTLSDPELVQYLLAGERPDDDTIAHLVARIRGDRAD